MSKHLIRLYQSQLLRGTVDVEIEADSADAAAQIALTAAAGDADDDSGERRYLLPNGTRFHLDPEDEVIGGDIWAAVIIHGYAERTIGQPVRLDLDAEQALALSILLHRAIAICPDEHVATLYSGLTCDLPRPPEPDDAQPEMPARLPAAIPVTIQEDPVIDGIGMIRTTSSPPVMVAVLHDESRAAYEQAWDLASSLGVAITLANHHLR